MRTVDNADWDDLVIFDFELLDDWLVTPNRVNLSKLVICAVAEQLALMHLLQKLIRAKVLRMREIDHFALLSFDNKDYAGRPDWNEVNDFESLACVSWLILLGSRLSANPIQDVVTLGSHA